MRRVRGEKIDRLGLEPALTEFVDLPGRYDWIAHRITRPGYQRLVAWLEATRTVGQTMNDTQLSAVVAESRVGWARQEFPGAGRNDATDQKLRAAAKEIHAQWIKHLRPYPDWVIRRAFHEYQSEKVFAPQPAEIVGRCKALWPHASFASDVQGLIEQAEALRPDWKEGGVPCALDSTPTKAC